MLPDARPPAHPPAQPARQATRWRCAPPRLLLGLLLFTAIPAAAATPLCADLPAGSITVKRLESPVRFNFDYSHRQLKSMGDHYARQDIDMLGLARTESVAAFEARLSSAVDPSGQWECTSITLSLEYGFNPLTVYVGREFPQGSCAHQEILDHEMRHVAAYQEHARKIEAEINEVLQRRFDQRPPTRRPVGEAREKLQQELNDRWIPFVKRLLGQVDRLHRVIDSPEEYRRVAASCNGEIQRYLK